MMVTDCGACGKQTGWVFGAQFSNKNQHVIICMDCWENGQRCWFDGSNLIVSDKQPENCRQAVLSVGRLRRNYTRRATDGGENY